MKLTNFDFIKETEARQAKQKPKSVSNQREIEKSKLSERLDHVILNRLEPFDLAKERIIGDNNLMSINYLQLGFIASNSICRIHVKNIKGGNEGYGTGFLITPNLILTNNHVFESSDFAINSFAEFNYQYDLDGKPSESFIFEFDPKNFFFTNKELDYTIVAINQTSKAHAKKIQEFGYLKLNLEPNKALIDEYVSIIQHPGGGYKQIAIRENKVESRDDYFLTYSTDTAQGSSGSPVLNDQWQVVALHHSGVPRKDEQGNYLCKNGSIYQKGMDESLIDWVSNEGVRISAILSDIKLNCTLNNYVNEIFKLPAMLNERINTEQSTFIPQKNNNKNTSTSIMNNKITFTIPIEISVGLGENLNSEGSKQYINTPINNEPNIAFNIEKAKDQDYTGRNGYDAKFVATDDFKIEINDLLKNQKNVLAPLLNPTDNNKHLLHYYNFSVAINKNRKLCTMTAVNINGRELENLKRENTKWILDPRMDDKYQTGPSVYANNDLDRGHMVRRLDPVWGINAESANDDTFHFTNSTPQHKNLNQKTWLSLEEYILKNSEKEHLKASVFTGPVFSENDIPYRGVLLPLQFWKVVTMIKTDGTPSITGYLLKQPDDIENFRTMEGIREDGFGKFKTYQVPLQHIANLTGLEFDKYNAYDPLQGLNFNETNKLIEINGKNDIKL